MLHELTTVSNIHSIYTNKLHTKEKIYTNILTFAKISRTTTIIEKVPSGQFNPTFPTVGNNLFI